MASVRSRIDHLHHWPAIGRHLGIKPDAARHLAKTQGLPVYRLGKTVCASRSGLDQWLAAQIGGKSDPAPLSAQLNRIEAVLDDLIERVAALEEARHGERS